MNTNRTVSIIINTDGRAASLATTLESLRYLDYPNFEVCAVYGPTIDGTRELLEARASEIKVAHCPVRNLSMSRNIGIAIASGEILAFLDDDFIPEPEWLLTIVKEFDNPKVGASGGFLYDNSGIEFQWRFGTANRFGRADRSWRRPSPELNFPFSSNFPHVMANSAFRKSAVVAVGGFDEQYEYFLDETDLVCRLVDHGWLIAQINGACVHHKFKPSHIRSEGVFRSWYAIVKSKIYFSLINTHGHHSVLEAINDARLFIDEFRNNLEWGISVGLATADEMVRFRQEIDRALRDGLTEGLAGRRKLPDQNGLNLQAPQFLTFRSLQPANGRRTFCLLTRTYPPKSIGGIGRYVHQLARSMAAIGHQIHVLTQADELNTVDFEDGVWVHRICPKHGSTAPNQLNVPPHIWDHSNAMLREVERIAQARRVDAVYAPIWDCEGLAILLQGKFPLVTSLQTTLHFWLQSELDKRSDQRFMAEFGRPMLALEKLLLKDSAGIHAISHAIAQEIEKAYNLELRPPRLAVVPLGQEDWNLLPFTEADQLPKGYVRVLFVGRLEERKGIDVLLQVLRRVLPRYPQVHVDLVGNDRLPGPGGVPYRAAFDNDVSIRPFSNRIRFHGELSEEKLRGLYRACDIFVAPSRFNLLV